MIDGAIAHARACGVPEGMIQRVIDQAGAGRGGAVVPAVLAGQLHGLANQYQREHPAPEQ
jgi:hypothetical protein